jgi:UMF1 family MFS transporter
VERGVSDFWYNMIFTIGSLMILLTAPILGSIADSNGKETNYLNRITVLAFVSFLIVSLIALFFPHRTLTAIVFFILGNYFYQFSFVFYNALLYKISPSEKWARISGIGQAGNWLGQIFGLLVTFPLATGALYLFGAAGRAQTLLPATILFFLLALPMLILFKLPKKENVKKINLKEEYKLFFLKLKDLLANRNVLLFLVAFFFFNDAIITAANNFPIYLENVFAVSDITKSILMAGILFTSAIGAFAAGYVADRVGLKKSLVFILGSWIIIFPVLAFASNFKLFTVMTCLMGFFYGATWAVTRATMTALCPKDKLNFGFSFYTLSERVSTFVGPLAWGLFTTLLLGAGPTRYRYAVCSMAVFVAIGIFFLNKVEIKKV